MKFVPWQSVHWHTGNKVHKIFQLYYFYNIFELQYYQLSVPQTKQYQGTSKRTGPFCEGVYLIGLTQWKIIKSPLQQSPHKIPRHSWKAFQVFPMAYPLIGLTVDFFKQRLEEFKTFAMVSKCLCNESEIRAAGGQLQGRQSCLPSRDMVWKW